VSLVGEHPCKLASRYHYFANLATRNYIIFFGVIEKQQKSKQRGGMEQSDLILIKKGGT